MQYTVLKNFILLVWSFRITWHYIINYTTDLRTNMSRARTQTVTRIVIPIKPNGAKLHSELQTKTSAMWHSFLDTLSKGEILQRCDRCSLWKEHLLVLFHPLGVPQSPRPWNVKLPWLMRNWFRFPTDLRSRGWCVSLRQESKLKGCELCATSAVDARGCTRFQARITNHWVYVSRLYTDLHRLCIDFQDLVFANYPFEY